MAVTDMITKPIEGLAKRHFQTYKGLLVILGGGWNVWDDYKAYPRREDGHVMVINDIGMFFPKSVKHWFSSHANQLQGWQSVRLYHHEAATFLHSNDGVHCPHNVAAWPVPQKGTSTFSAVCAAILMGYDEIMLCGCPMDDGGHFYRPDDMTSFVAEGNQRVWLNARDKWFDGKVKSMSGWTKTWLSPDG